jgi:hypothetical protein
LECLSGSGKAGRSESAAVIDGAHGFVATVPRDPHVIVLNYILLNKCLSGSLSNRLSDGLVVHVCFGQEPIVARDVRGHLGCADTIVK